MILIEMIDKWQKADPDSIEKLDVGEEIIEYAEDLEEALKPFAELKLGPGGYCSEPLGKMVAKAKTTLRSAPEIDIHSLAKDAKDLAADFRRWASECPPESRQHGLHLTREEQLRIANLLDLMADVQHNLMEEIEES